MIVSDTRYGRTKARKAAQAKANECGRKVYLQLDPVIPRWHVTAEKRTLDVFITRNGPMYLGMRWFEFYPQPTCTCPDDCRCRNPRPDTTPPCGCKEHQ